jgi:hypothetical protein
MRMIHSRFTKGAPIRLILKDGKQVITKFVDYRKGKSINTRHGEFRILDIRSANYYKPLPWER